MKILVLGGTVFLGRHFVEIALSAGHQVTLFNRGRTKPDLFPNVEKLRGDRRQDLTALEDKSWDAVLDTSGYLPRDVFRSADQLSGAAEHYTFISTISVYRDLPQTGLDESAPTEELEGRNPHRVTEQTYGPLKAQCERAAVDAFGRRVFIVRPGLIVGPYDPTGRFTYWPRRMARGGEVLAPGEPDRPVQLIDVRDLASWILDSMKAGRTGAYNAAGPASELKMEEMLKVCRQVAGGEAELTWIGEEYLLGTGVQPFSELPLWLPQDQNGLLQVDNKKAVADGLHFRPLKETAQETLDWDEQVGGPINRGPGLDPARELALLQAWHAQNDQNDE